MTTALTAAPAAPLRRLGTWRVEEFLARHWQRQAVCIRQAIAGFSNPVSRARLFDLARSADVESRLVSAFAGRWKVRQGPFASSALPSLRRAGWTLLVQGVDLHDSATAALAARFRFLPAARFDDVMISYASDRGGVGPHVDQYDVFLLQGQGRRRWRIAVDFDPRLIDDMPLRMLANFRHDREWILEPGDLLYLPPGVAHEGVALDQSITISIGFRLPAWQEVAEAWSEHRARVAPRSGRVPDFTRSPTRTPARLPAAMVDAVVRELRRGAPARVEARRTLLEHLSEPKPTVIFNARRHAIGLPRFVQAAGRRGVAVDLRTRMLYEDGDLAINGELQSVTGTTGLLLRCLANHGRLSAAALRSANAREASGLFSLLHNWYRYGWIHLAGD